MKPRWGLFFCFLASIVQSQVPGDERWDHRFGVPGSDDITLCLSTAGSNVYLGGFFTEAGSANANRIARWDGVRWSPLGQGIVGPVDQPYVWAIAARGNEVYAGGSFTNAGGLPAQNIAKWDGANWTSVGGGLGGVVTEIAFVGDDVYAAGVFSVGADTNGYLIARWDGTQWHPLGRVQPNEFAFALGLLVDGTDIYVVGTFSSVDGLPVNNIAHWNGVAWDDMDGGLTGRGVRVEAVTKYNGEVYAGGQFWQAGAAMATNLARWSGATWSAVTLTRTNPVMDFAVRDGSLYVAGMFTQIAGMPANCIARWDGFSWSALGEGVRPFGIGSFSGGIYDLEFNDNGILYAAGHFIAAGTNAAANVAAWDGSRWTPLGGASDNGIQRFTSTVRAIEVVDDELYAGGLVRNAGTLNPNLLARWTGTNWHSLGGGLLGTGSAAVQAICKYGGYLYAGGVNITNAGGSVPATNIARWNGSNWEAVGRGVHSNISAMAVFRDLYIGGAFTNAGGVAANRIARWDGSAWSSIGSGANSNVSAMAATASVLYVGGAFSRINDFPLNRIGVWNGFIWQSLGNGVDTGTVNAIGVDGTNIYIGGTFTSVSGVSARRIAVWNGAAWSSLGVGTENGVDDTVRAILARNGKVYVGGDFTNAGSRVVNSIACWDGTNWINLGSGFGMNPGSPDVRSLGFWRNDLYVGGRFIRAGSKPSHYFARWMAESEPRLENVRLGQGGLQFDVPGMLGRRMRIQRSIDGSSWQEGTTLDGTTETITFSEPATEQHRIYRGLLVP